MQANVSPPLSISDEAIAAFQGGGRLLCAGLQPLRRKKKMQADAKATHVGYPLTPWTLEQNLVSWTQSTFTTYAGGSSMLLYLSASSFQAGCNLWQWPHLDSISQDEDKHNTLRGGGGYGIFQNVSYVSLPCVICTCASAFAQVCDVFVFVLFHAHTHCFQTYQS